MDEGVDQSLLVDFVLLIRCAPELLQHEKQLIAGIDGGSRWLLDGFHAIAQSGLLLLQFAQSGGKTRTVGPVLNSAQDIVLFLGAFQQFGFKHFLLRVDDVLLGLLHLHNTVGDLL
ncbi:hypothetical protein B5G38_14315 [Gemmiger sp. An87]|nr:hypothetical protein B5G38_14315 [Gemmiger sp. An87]